MAELFDGPLRSMMSNRFVGKISPAERPRWVAHHGPFALIELWIEGWVLVELLTVEMASDYRRLMTIANWRSWA